jgi:hypothetical protein
MKSKLLRQKLPPQIAKAVKKRIKGYNWIERAKFYEELRKENDYEPTNQS